MTLASLTCGNTLQNWYRNYQFSPFVYHNLTKLPVSHPETSPLSGGPRMELRT